MDNIKLYQETLKIFNKYKNELCISGSIIDIDNLSDEQYENAHYHYAYSAKKDMLLGIIDITGNGSCKMGYAFSCYSITCLERKDDVQFVPYSAIQKISYDKCIRIELTDKIVELFGTCFRYEIFCKMLTELKEAIIKYPDEKKYRKEIVVQNLSFDDKYKIIRSNMQKISNGYNCYYSDYIPDNILKNVIKKYDKKINPSEILGIVDTSLLGNGKSGCLFTDKGFYWTESFSPVQYIAYDDINTVVCIKDNTDASDDYLLIMNHYDMKAKYVRYNSLKKEPLEKLLEQLQTKITKAIKIEDEVGTKENIIPDKIEEKSVFYENKDIKQFQAKYEWINACIKETKLVKEGDKVRISFVEFEDKPCAFKIYFGRDLTKLYKQIEKCPSFKNLARIYEYVYYDGNTYVLEERLAGETLAEIIENRGVIKEKDFLNICMEICDALEVLHNCNPPIIHRDIKPSNIMVLYDNRVKLFDYDASRITYGQKSQDTILMGTARYAPPEQFGGRETGTYSDIYSFGMTMCEMLTGELPIFKGKETHILYKGKYENIIRKCVEYDFDKRYSNIEELRRDLVR